MEIKCMLLTEVWDKSVLNGDSKYYQIKENGIRALIHIKDNKIVGIRNRNNQPIFYLFPDLKGLEFPFSTGVLDSEIVVYKNGKSVFYKGIDQRRSVPSEKVLKEFPATLVIFDALKIDSEILIMKPYKYRYEKLLSIKETERLKIAKNYNGIELWNKVVTEDLEGVVIKNPNALYEIDKRSKEYLKFKNYKLAEVTIEKTEINDKGSKVFGKAVINGNLIEVECQIPGIFDIPSGTLQRIKYLDIIGNRLIQPTIVNQQQINSMSVIAR